MRPSGGMVARSMRRDQAVRGVKVAPGTLRRILGLLRQTRVIVSDARCLFTLPDDASMLI